jgi:protein TonB
MNELRLTRRSQDAETDAVPPPIVSSFAIAFSLHVLVIAVMLYAPLDFAKPRIPSGAISVNLVSMPGPDTVPGPPAGDGAPEVDRRTLQKTTPPAVDTVTIALVAASPRMEQAGPTPDTALRQPIGGQPDVVSISKDPAVKAASPQRASVTTGKSPSPRKKVKSAAPATPEAESKAAMISPSEPQGQTSSEFSGDEILPQEEGQSPSYSTGSRAAAGSGQPKAVRSPVDPAVQEEARPDYDRNPAPEYPARAKQLGFEGTVLLNVKVNPAGGVDDVKIAASSTYSMLDEAALRAAKAWVFKPARRGDQPVAAWVQVPVRYTLKPPGSRMP